MFIHSLFLPSPFSLKLAHAHKGNCRTPRCEALFGDTDMAVRWGEGGKSTLSGWTKRDFKSMKCFILGRPTEMIDYY